MATTLAERNRMAERMARLLFVDPNVIATLDKAEMRQIVQVVDQFVDDNGAALLQTVRQTVGNNNITADQVRLAMMILLSKDFDGKIV